MKPTRCTAVVLSVAFLAAAAVSAPAAPRPSAGAQAAATPGSTLELGDVFDLEWVSDPQISPDGSSIVYVRNYNDIMSDSAKSNLWIVDVASGEHRPLTTGLVTDRSPRWSPDGSKLLYVSSREGGAELWLRWMDSGATAKLTNLERSPGNIAWSPDGERIAFSMFVPEASGPFARVPSPPEGASWAPPAKVIRKLRYRADGAGYLEDGFTHLFVVPAQGGAPRQLTSGDFNDGGPLSWTPDGSTIVFAANRRDDWEDEPSDSDVWALTIEDGALQRLTDRLGPDDAPVVSPDGRRIAWVGYPERYQGYQVSALNVMNRDGSGQRVVSEALDRDVQGQTWRADGSGLFFQYDDQGNTKVAFISLDGEVTDIARNVGGLSLGRPYTGGSFSVAANDRIAFTLAGPDHPSDLGVVEPDWGRGGEGGELRGAARRLTRVNEGLFDHKELGAVETFWYESSYDNRRIQGWIVTPPGFDPSRRYPLILEIHGGPFAAYSDFFAAELQLYAAAGYVVFYANPRGSTSYGEEFGNLIHHAYPSQDFDDLMSGVDAVIARGFIDEDNLFVTGGSGGGVLTAWIVGHTGRFTAAVSVKPVINWYSWTLTSDIATVYRNWFPGLPWDNLEHYMQRSPLQHVGNVTTPTMLMTGEVDYRTPISEAEQFYTALKLRGIDTALVRVQEASHGIANRPSNLMRKVAYVLEWFERHRSGGR